MKRQVLVAVFRLFQIVLTLCILALFASAWVAFNRASATHEIHKQVRPECLLERK